MSPVFLAGGREPGLGVLTEHRAAAAMPFGGKYRLIDFSLSNCHHAEIFQVALLTQHAPTSLTEHVGSGRPWDLDRAAGVQLLQPYALRESAKGPEIELGVWPCPLLEVKSACRVLVAPRDAALPRDSQRAAHATLRVDYNLGAPPVIDALQRLISGRNDESESAKAA